MVTTNEQPAERQTPSIDQQNRRALGDRFMCVMRAYLVVGVVTIAVEPSLRRILLAVTVLLAIRAGVLVALLLVLVSVASIASIASLGRLLDRRLLGGLLLLLLLGREVDLGIVLLGVSIGVLLAGLGSSSRVAGGGLGRVGNSIVSRHVLVVLACTEMDD